MNKIILEKYKETLEVLSEGKEQKNVKKLFYKSVLETDNLFNRLLKRRNMEFNYSDEKHAFMMVYFSYLMCKSGMGDIIKKLSDYFSENEQYEGTKENDIWNLDKGLENSNFYHNSFTFKNTLLDMITENKIKFFKMYKLEEIRELKNYI